MLKSLYGGAALALLFSCVPGLASAQDPAADDQDFVTKAAQANVNEVAFARTAVEQGESDDVKQFAERMIEDHEAANAELAGTAEGMGLTLPEEVDETHQQTLDQLAETTGPDFDRMYMDAQVKDHQEAVAMFTEQAGQAPAGEIESWAAKMLPALEDHLAMAQEIAGSLDTAAQPQISQDVTPGQVEQQQETAAAIQETEDADQAQQETAAATPTTQCQTDIVAFNEEATGSLRDSGAAIGRESSDEIRRLISAAQVFAANGNEEACQMVLGQIRETFTGTTEAFAQQYPDQDVYMTERTTELAAAIPVSEYTGVIRADDLIGSDVRNRENEDIGDVQDVILNPSDGRVAFVLIERGGFLGMGEDFVPVPFASLNVADEGDTYVLNMSDDQMDNAPTISQDQLENDSSWQSDVDAWWKDSANQPG